MNIFVLNAGRSGSTTFARACGHITNYSSAHESRMSTLGIDRLAYPDDHIEIDNRLAWLLGRMEEAYGDRAVYVHLRRDSVATAESLSMRIGSGIMQAYASAIIWQVPPEVAPMEVANDYLRTVEANINLFLRDKTRWLDFELESAHRDFPWFWEYIEAEGDYDAALAEFDIRHNARPR